MGDGRSSSSRPLDSRQFDCGGTRLNCRDTDTCVSTRSEFYPYFPTTFEPPCCIPSRAFSLNNPSPSTFINFGDQLEHSSIVSDCTSDDSATGPAKPSRYR